jgi:hypothetical protein
MDPFPLRAKGYQIQRNRVNSSEKNPANKRSKLTRIVIKIPQLDLTMKERVGYLLRSLVIFGDSISLLSWLRKTYRQLSVEKHWLLTFLGVQNFFEKEGHYQGLQIAEGLM